MTTVPYSYTEEFSFKVPNDTIPPQNIEAEEAVLGGILLDREAIYRVKDWLRTEHFYIGSHQDIYASCLRLSAKNLPTDLLNVSSWLSDHDILARIGGRNKLATLIDRVVSAVNIDSLAALIIEKYKRRELIKSGNEAISLGYDTGVDLAESFVSISKRIQSITTTPLVQTELENRLWHYNSLLKELQDIHLKISDPGFKLYSLQELARRIPGKNIRDLDDLYLKSLCATVGPRLNLDQLEQKIGATGRTWVLGGILPEATTALVIADGGVGKTKWLYDLLHCIASGKNWNGFPVTADSRRVLIYQGDESEHDMLQALNKRGFTPGSEVRKRTEVRFGWNTDAMPIIYQDAEEFRPSVIMIDSLTFVQRYSLFDENRTEYSRAVLELNKFAAETGVTVVIVHHTNKNGQSRGTTAVRNAVSEVIKLEKDPNPSANVQEKILTIEKSRSRRFPASYRLFFNEEDFSFSLLEEVGQELGSPDMDTKDRIVKFLQEHGNIKFEAEEVAHHISTTSGNARRCLSQLARDGLVSLDERTFSGTKKLYYIAYQSEYCSTKRPLQSVTVTSSQRITPENDSNTCETKEKSANDNVYKNSGSPVITSMITLDDHLCNAPQSDVQEHSLGSVKRGDHLSTPENAKKAEWQIEEKTQKNDALKITSLHNSQDTCCAGTLDYKEGDHERRSQGDPIQPSDHLEADSLHNSVLQTSIESPIPEIHYKDDNLAKNQNSTKQKIDYQFWLIDPTTLTIAIPSQFGDIACTAEPTATIINRAKVKTGYACRLTMYCPDGTKTSIKDVRVEAATGKKDFEALAQRIAKEWAEKEYSELPAGWMHPEAIAQVEIGSIVYIKNLRSGSWTIGKIKEYCDRGGFLEVLCKGKVQKIFSVETIAFK